jgi:hypothetical protein
VREDETDYVKEFFLSLNNTRVNYPDDSFYEIKFVEVPVSVGFVEFALTMRMRYPSKAGARRQHLTIGTALAKANWCRIRLSIYRRFSRIFIGPWRPISIRPTGLRDELVQSK